MIKTFKKEESLSVKQLAKSTKLAKASEALLKIAAERNKSGASSLFKKQPRP
jgi:hypothetical protein